MWPQEEIQLSHCVMSDRGPLLNIEPLADDSCEEIIVHLESWTKGQEEIIKLNPKEENRLVIKIGAQD